MTDPKHRITAYLSNAINGALHLCAHEHMVGFSSQTVVHYIDECGQQQQMIVQCVCIPTDADKGQAMHFAASAVAALEHLRQNAVVVLSHSIGCSVSEAEKQMNGVDPVKLPAYHGYEPPPKCRCGASMQVGGGQSVCPVCDAPSRRQRMGLDDG